MATTSRENRLYRKISATDIVAIVEVAKKIAVQKDGDTVVKTGELKSLVSSRIGWTPTTEAMRELLKKFGIRVYAVEALSELGRKKSEAADRLNRIEKNLEQIANQLGIKLEG